jgi:hypothetical protein
VFYLILQLLDDPKLLTQLTDFSLHLSASTSNLLHRLMLSQIASNLLQDVALGVDATTL